MESTDTRLVEAYRAADLIEAHAIQIALADVGIRAEIDGEALLGSEYPLGWATAPRILVAESLVMLTREIIVEAHELRATGEVEVDSNSELLRCLACGRAMEKADTCPACGWTYQAKAEA